MREDLSRTASLGGAVAAAFAASACCIGPLIFALAGIGGAGALVALEPYRPVFTALTAGLLGAGWYLTYRETKPAKALPTGPNLLKTTATPDDCGCEMPKANRAGKRLLWVATAIAAFALGFPYLTPYLF